MPFSQKTLDFLLENRLMDSKIWFDEHRDDFKKYVQEPLIELAESMLPEMLKIDSRFIDEPRKCVSRIYRDSRFLRNRSIYRENMWISFMRDKKLYNGLPGFFFEVSPMGFSHGCGYYRADRDSMASMRKLILDGDRSFKKALKAFESQDVFELEGDMYKRSFAPDRPEKMRAWADRKTICLMSESGDMDMLFSKNLASILAADFTAIAPIYDFFCLCEAKKASESKI